MRRLHILGGLLLALFLPGQTMAQPAASPRPALRDGFWIGFGLGVGNVGYHADFSSVNSQNALSGHFRLGGTLNPQWRLGAETNGWTKSESGVDLRYGTLMGTATFYPSPAGNFFLKGGLGFGSYTESDGTDEIKADGTAAQLGIGYDLRFQGNVGMSFVANYIKSSSWEVALDGTNLGVNADPTLFQVGVGVMWH